MVEVRNNEAMVEGFVTCQPDTGTALIGGRVCVSRVHAEPHPVELVDRHQPFSLGICSVLITISPLGSADIGPVDHMHSLLLWLTHFTNPPLGSAPVKKLNPSRSDEPA